MSYKYQAVKHSENHYVLPKIKDMKTDVHAFLSDDLYASSDEEAWAQIAHGASVEGVTGAYLMPDTHLGFGVPIGSVIVTDNTILQCGSGYDINCGVLYLKLNGISATDIKGKYERGRWIKQLEKRIAFGKGSSHPELAKKYSKSKCDDVLRFGAKALNIKADVCERQYIEIPTDLDLNKISMAYDKVQPQLGSVGGGNHFIELQVDSNDGSVWAMVHCGSRGFGWQVANYFFYQGARLRGLPSNRREESWLYVDEPLGQEYWSYHNAAANFAIANRHVIVDAVREASADVFKADAEVYYEISHNLVQKETIVLPDGSTKKGFVHRKGATRAFPAGHPDLVGTKWETTGHPVCIPGSMFTGGAILFPKENAYISGCSVNHGSGRILARGKAKRELENEQQGIDDEMRTVKRSFAGVEIEGVVGNWRNTPLDECGRVYKDLDSVLEVLSNLNIAKVERRLYPVANLKGSD